MITACLIGVSGYGKVHYHDLLGEVAAGHLRLVGATVINQAEEAEKCAQLRALGCALFDDYRVMLDALRGTIDLCLVPTAIHLHAPMTIAALRAGANVLVEKPAAALLQEIRAMQQVERETGRFVAVGFQSMYARETMMMKRAILGGELGALRTIVCHALWPRLDDYYTRNGWAGRLSAGGHWVLDSPFNNAIAHQLNMILFLAGESERVSARPACIEAELYRAHAIESADTVSMRIITANRLPLHFFATHCSASTLDPEIEVRCERGSLHWTFTSLRITLPDGSSTEIPCASGDEVRRSMLASVLARIADPTTFVCDLGIAAAHTLCVNGAHQSSAVRTIDPTQVRRESHAHSVKTVIVGIDALIARAAAEERHFSALGASWARPASPVSLLDYGEFTGPLLEG